MNKRICIVAEHYPTDEEPMFTFVQQLAYSLSKEGVECYVIAPQSITRNIIRHQRMKPIYSLDYSPEGIAIKVYRPFFITVSNVKNKYLQRFEDWMMGRVILKSLEKIGQVDAIYCYFWHVALTASIALRNSNVPLYVQASECSLTIDDYMITDENLGRIKGVVCASKKNQDESIEAGLTTLSNTRIIVNGFRKDQFYKISKSVARKKLNFPQNDFIVAFVGGFIERKGIRELCEAINQLKDVKSIFIGTGDIEPKCDGILYKGRVPHEKIVNYLNCADIFVLPTKAEGCCNAIIEALACGLPVISSNKTFNDEILDESCSIRLDETNVDALAEAISILQKNEDLRRKMSNAALEKAQSLTIDHRAKAIVNYVLK